MGPTSGETPLPVGAASAAMGACHNLARCRGIAAGAAPTVTVSLPDSVAHTPAARLRHPGPRAASGALPSLHLSAWKSRRVPPSGPVAAGEGSEWKKPAG